MTSSAFRERRPRITPPVFSLSVSSSSLKVLLDDDKLLTSLGEVGGGRPRIIFDAARLSSEVWEDAIGRLITQGVVPVAWMLPGGFVAGPGDFLSDCPTSPRSQEELKEIARRTASQCEEILVGRGLCSRCECEMCRREKGKHTWAEYRRYLMLKLWRECLLAPAKEVRPDVKLSLIVPSNLPEGRRCGYDIAALSSHVHRFIVDRESGRDESDAGVSFVSLEHRRIEELAGKKAGGALLSFPDEAAGGSLAHAMTERVLAGAPELILHVEEGEQIPLLLETLSAERASLEWLYGVARKTPLRGVAAYLPAGSVTDETDLLCELKLHGLPIRPTPRFPSSSRSALFTLPALNDREFPERLAIYLESGGVAALTSALKETIKERGRWHDALDAAQVWPSSHLDPTGEPGKAGAQAESDALRGASERLLAPLGVSYSGPRGVTLHLFGYADAVLHSHLSTPAAVRLTLIGKRLRVMAASTDFIEPMTELDEGEVVLPPRSWIHLKG